ncbi:hypothetical protein [Bradyrhizobium icense]|uniref:hypothetical protein n=1 Tax=Bradyrhizobium icense TaxID=1274631 RepID=UPI0012EA06B6|nr:hypothetical protein [Bradyrhizobium icense]
MADSERGGPAEERPAQGEFLGRLSSAHLDLDHAVPHPDRIVGRAHQYRAAIRHPALLVEGSPVGSVLINKITVTVYLIAAGEVQLSALSP